MTLPLGNGGSSDTCSECHREVDGHDRFCRSCGNPLPEDAVAQTLPLAEVAPPVRFFSDTFSNAENAELSTFAGGDTARERVILALIATGASFDETMRALNAAAASGSQVTERVPVAQQTSGEFEEAPDPNELRTPAEVVEVCAQIVADCGEIEQGIKDRVIRIRKAVQGEIRWGGLIFNPEDIRKKLADLHTYLSELVGSGRMLGLSGDLIRITTWQTQYGHDYPQEWASANDSIVAALEAVPRAQDQVNSIIGWIDDFWVALSSTNSARSLLPILPGFAFDDASSNEPQGFFDRLLGRS